VHAPATSPPPFDFDTLVESVGEESLTLGSNGGSPCAPLYIIDRSAAVNQAEAELRCALLVIIGGTHPAVAPLQVVQAMARGFNIDEISMAVSWTTLKDFLLRLLSLAVAERVFNDGMPFQGPRFTLFFKWWTRRGGGGAPGLHRGRVLRHPGPCLGAFHRSVAARGRWLGASSS
jgi:hypothetical protein